MALTDTLAGLYTWRFMEPTLRNEADIAQQRGHSPGVRVVAIDHFKSVNGTNGHARPGHGLGAGRTWMRSACRAYDNASRYGGEAFPVLLPGIDTGQLQAVAQRIVTTDAATPARLGSHTNLHVTVSVGMVVFPLDVPGRLPTLPGRRRGALRGTGRNRVVAVAPDGWLSQGQLIPQAAA